MLPGAEWHGVLWSPSTIELHRLLIEWVLQCVVNYPTLLPVAVLCGMSFNNDGIPPSFDKKGAKKGMDVSVKPWC